jgi:hypothetical protein
MSAICEFILNRVRCDRLAVTSIDNRNMCWEHAVIRKQDDALRSTRDLWSETLSRKDVTLPKDLEARIKTHLGMLSHAIESAFI